MNKIIRELKDLYLGGNKIKSYSAETINVLAHKDRVGFFVLNQKNDNKYILYIYSVLSGKILDIRK